MRLKFPFDEFDDMEFVNGQKAENIAQRRRENNRPYTSVNCECAFSLLFAIYGINKHQTKDPEVSVVLQKCTIQPRILEIVERKKQQHPARKRKTKKKGNIVSILVFFFHLKFFIFLFYKFIIAFFVLYIKPVSEVDHDIKRS